MGNVIIGRYKPGLALKSIYSDRRSGLEQAEQEYFHLPSHSAQGITLPWPESSLPWPKGVVGVLATSNALKIQEHDRPLRGHDFRIVSHTQMVGGSEDSMEEESNVVDIAKGKVEKSVLSEWDVMTEDERREAVRAVGAESAQHIIIMAEDRELKLDPRLKESSVWEPFRELHLVREIFDDPAHLFPGKRFNELMNASGGAINFLDLVENAKKELRQKGVSISDEHSSYITYFIRPLEPGLLPLPSEGIFMTASEKGRRFRPIFPEDRAREAAKNVVEPDYFDIPRGYGELVDLNGRHTHTVHKLRYDPDSQYFLRDYYAARAVIALADVLKIPKLEHARTYKPIDNPDARIISNHNFGEFSRDFNISSGVNGHRRAAYVSRIQSHEDLELGFMNSEGVVIEAIAGPPPGADPDMFSLIKRLEANLVAANRLALKPLAEQAAFGRPIAIHDRIRAEMAWYYYGAKFRTITARPEDTIFSYAEEDELAEGLKWEQEKFRPNPAENPEYRLINENELAEIIGVSNLGFVYAPLGSASSHIPSGNNDALQFNIYAAQAGMTQSHGGGSRYIMRKFFEGAFEAIKSGNDNFLNLAVRVPVASRKEGSLRPLLNEYGLKLDPGYDFSDRHYSFGNGKFHVLNTNYIGERQHAIMGPAHAVVNFIGGAGRAYEFFIAAYHNTMVEHRGYGIFPGFSGNTQKKRIYIVNSEVENGAGKRGYDDGLRAMFNDRQWRSMDAHFFGGASEAFNAMTSYAHDLGYGREKPMQAEYGLTSARLAENVLERA